MDRYLPSQVSNVWAIFFGNDETRYDGGGTGSVRPRSASAEAQRLSELAGPLNHYLYG